MAALASDWLRNFSLLLWNRLTEFNETWQEARSQCPLPSLCFSGRLEKQDGRSSLSYAKTFSTFTLKSLNRIQRKLSGSKIIMSPTKFVFLRPIKKWLHWPLRQKGGTLYWGAGYLALWASCMKTLRNKKHTIDLSICSSIHISVNWLQKCESLSHFLKYNIMIQHSYLAWMILMIRSFHCTMHCDLA